MSQSNTIDRLRDYLRQLPPQATALLQAEYERVLARGQDPVASFVLNELRAVAAPPIVPEPPAVAEPSMSAEPPAPAEAVEPPDLFALVFAPVELFLVDRSDRDAVVPGQVRKSSLAPFWKWVTSDGMPTEIAELETAVVQAKTPAAVTAAVRRFQSALTNTVTQITKETDQNRHKSAMRLGGPTVLEDVVAATKVFRHRDVLDALAAKLPSNGRALADSHLTSVKMIFTVPAFQAPAVLPYSLALLASRLDARWQIVRLACAMAETDDAVQVASHPYSVAVDLALDDVKQALSQFRAQIRRGRFDDSAGLLKTIHDALRGLRTELDIRKDSRWGKQLAAIRVEISSLLESEIETVPGRVRRLLRQRPDKDISSTATLDRADVAETEGMIDFLATCRNYASELAVNEVTSRTFSEIQQYVEASTKSLVETLRSNDEKVRRFRKMQADAAIRFCAIIFGDNYAGVMKKAVDVALQGDRAMRAG